MEATGFLDILARLYQFCSEENFLKHMKWTRRSQSFTICFFWKIIAQVLTSAIFKVFYET